MSAEAIDAFLALYDEGFVKLARFAGAAAMRFPTAPGYTVCVPHAMDARRAGRVLVLKARREREQGSLIRAPRRTLAVAPARPRPPSHWGPQVVDLASMVLERMAIEEVILPLLGDPGLDGAPLRPHPRPARRARVPIDGPLRGGAGPVEYLMSRATLRDLVLHQDRLRRGIMRTRRRGRTLHHRGSGRAAAHRPCWPGMAGAEDARLNGSGTWRPGSCR